MEAHHHSKVHHEKKWKEYLFEFLMLFLAVSAGFFVENIRENYQEKLRAKEYAHMLLKDIVKDTVELHNLGSYYQQSINAIDTLEQLRQQYGTAIADIDFYRYGRYALGAYRMSFNDATLQQLKNSGNLRYFGNLQLKEKVSEYDNSIRTFLLREDLELSYKNEVDNFYNNLFNFDKFQLAKKAISNKSLRDSLEKVRYTFLINNAALQNGFLMFSDLRKRTWQLRKEQNIDPTLAIARDLIALLKKQFNLQ
jgi:hypothetical protein